MYYYSLLQRMTFEESSARDYINETSTEVSTHCNRESSTFSTPMASKRKHDASDEEATKRQAANDDSLFTLTEIKRQELKKWKNEQVWYKIAVNDRMKGKKIRDIYSDLYDVIQKAIEEVGSRHHPRDLMRVYVNHPNLDSPFSVQLTPIEELNAEAVLRRVESLLQSNTDLNLDDGIELNIGVQQIGKGGRGTKITNIQDALKKKSSIVEIQNTDTLCMARAIVVCLAKLNNDPDYTSIIKKRYNIQERRAFHLQAQAGIPTDRYSTFDDIKHFENVCQTRIIVVSTLPGNPVTYIGNKDYDQQIFLLHDTHTIVCSVTSHPLVRHT